MKFNRFRSKNIFIAAILFFAAANANAVLNIDITEGVEGAMPVAVVPFRWSGGVKLADADVSAIITSDLARSGKFSPLPEKDMLSKPTTPEQIDFKTWRIAGIDHLVIGGVQLQKDGNYQVQFRLFDVLKAQQVLGYSFPADKQSLRYIAHRISDYIIEQVTGLGPAFDSRIAYVTSSRSADKKIEYRLQVADTDGFNPQTLLTSKQPIMSPVWSPDSGSIAYVSFELGKAEVYIHHIRTGQREKVSSYEGINGAPAWSPDGKRLALTLSKDGNSDIYVLNLQNKQLVRITSHWGIDTEAAWMPDGKSLVFTSSRSGKPQLYQVELSSTAQPKRLTFEGDYNASASISPDGKAIALVYGEGSSFRIAVLYPETRLLQVLSDGPQDESPEFAPNGSMILYATLVNGRGVLAAVSTDGRHKQRLVLSDGEVREPSWAPVRKSRN
jgi:TolB protein